MNDQFRPSADAPLLERLDYFFSGPDITGAIGDFLSVENDRFHVFADSAEAHESYLLFKRYGGLIEKLLESFCRDNAVTFEDLSSTIIEEYNQLEKRATPYICVGYIAGALDLEKFGALVNDINDITQYRVGDEDENNDNEEEESALEIAEEEQSSEK
jgi:hypothetical protein